MIQAKQIKLMKPKTVFVNVSRGPIVNSQDLINRLKKNDMVACLDVFDPEPIPVDSEIRTLDNVFLSPHIAGTTEKSRTRFFTEMLKELNRYFSGHKTLHNITEMTIANRSGRVL
jgi:phosphoglycerate dehydrogenase-like enzyme